MKLFIDNLFKILYLILGICLVTVLYGIYIKMDIGRYYVSDRVTFDTKTGQKYYLRPYGDGYFILNKNGDEIKSNWFPKQED